ncbi:hypothetical protein COW53_00995 [bacterium CG17_big_fil_post_rev_8_21_14_2_50_64_8]|nr:MAG: hypothetical protein COW53_00995 [bacterium CG17_big_fil_post_rev_8_21_14_2_50_64_8]
MRFFEDFVRQAKTGTLPPAIRTLISKGKGKGTRPIDDPAEVSRECMTLVASDIEDTIERHLSPGQFGGRASRYVTKVCNSKGAGPIDHMAGTAWCLIRAWFSWVVSLDLEDAFGRIPHPHLSEILSQLDFSQEYIKLILSLVRIDALDAKTRKRLKEQNQGISQGGILSSMAMNLVLAPILRHVEQETGTKCAAYLDDVYIFAKSESEAHRSFKCFESYAESLGFDNVRPLGTEGKATRIIDTLTSPLTLVSTYLVDTKEIGLTEQRLEFLRKAGEERLRFGHPSKRHSPRHMEGCPNPVKLKHLGEMANARAVSRTWAKRQGLCANEQSGDLKSPQQRGSSDPPMGRPSPRGGIGLANTLAGGCAAMAKGKGLAPESDLLSAVCEPHSLALDGDSDSWAGSSSRCACDEKWTPLYTDGDSNRDSLSIRTDCLCSNSSNQETSSSSSSPKSSAQYLRQI